MTNDHILDFLDKTHKGNKYFELFKTVYLYTLDYLKLNEKIYECSLTLVGNDEIQQLNKTYRKLDKPTDVLTFASMEADFVSDEPIVDLGSIIISLDVAKVSAKNYHHPFKRELAFLFIHGLLHSVGYDHHRGEKEAEEMFALQNDILNSLPIDFYSDMKSIKENLLKAKDLAYAPYSEYKVGAVVYTKNKKGYLGCNIENASYPLSICAERSALINAYTNGVKKDDIVSISVISNTLKVAKPCGACLQVISELMNKNCHIYLFNKDCSKMEDYLITDLLKFCFSKEDLK